MATLKELMGDLTRGDGRKVYPYKDNRHFEPIFLDKHGFWWGIDENQEQYGIKENFSVRTDPVEAKAKKIVKLYRPIIKEECSTYWVQDWVSNKHYKPHGKQQIVGWQEIEVEVDE